MLPLGCLLEKNGIFFGMREGVTLVFTIVKKKRD